MPDPQNKKIIEHASVILREEPGIAAVYLLGTVVTGNMRDDSDIDIALLPVEGRSFSMQKRLTLAASLELHLGRAVDIGILTPSNLVYASEAILKGQRIATLNKDYADAMETRLLGCYLQLREDRREVEEAYRVS